MTKAADKQLQEAVNRLNKFFQLPVDSWTDGKSNIGNIKLDSAYGKTRLVQIANEHGGINVISSFKSKRETLEYIYAIAHGGEIMRKTIEKYSKGE